MNRRYKVIWSDVAEEDLRNVIEYIAADSPSNALKILHRDEVGDETKWGTGIKDEVGDGRSGGRAYIVPGTKWGTGINK